MQAFSFCIENASGHLEIHIDLSKDTDSDICFALLVERAFTIMLQHLKAAGVLIVSSLLKKDLSDIERITSVNRFKIRKSFLQE